MCEEKNEQNGYRSDWKRPFRTVRKCGTVFSADSSSSFFSSFFYQRCKVELCRLEHLIKNWALDRRLQETTNTGGFTRIEPVFLSKRRFRNATEKPFILREFQTKQEHVSVADQHCALIKTF